MDNNTPSYFLSIDQSTSGTKAIVFSKDGKLLHRVDKSHEQFHPQPGWVEHDPEEIFKNVLLAINNVLSKANIDASEIICISISNQRETTLIWDGDTGKPIMNAVVWQCQRAESICNELKEKGYGSLVQEKTGLVLSPYFSAAKAKWMVDHLDTASQKLLFGTMDSYLIWKLTGGEVHATDHTNASRTQLFNIRDLQWDQDLIEIFGLTKLQMPKVLSSNGVFGRTAQEILGMQIPIVGVLGDSHAAIFGQCCTEPGMAKATYGTGSSVMMNIGKSPVEKVKDIVMSIGYSVDDEITYVLEGNINSTGATIKWLVDELELFSDAKDAGKFSQSVEDTMGVYFIPAFVGLGAPHWNGQAQASIVNLTLGANKAHIIRAAQEAIAYQIQDVITAMERESNTRLSELRVDGGPTRDDFLMQFQADLSNVKVARNQIEELSATGAMFMGGLGMGIWKSLDEIGALRVVDQNYLGAKDELWREKQYSGWKKAVQDLLSSTLTYT